MISDFSDRLARVDFYSSKTGYIDKRGRVKIFFENTKYSDSRNFSEGYAAVRDSDTGKWGYIDKSEKLVIPCVYREAMEFHGWLAAVRDEDFVFGYIDKDNNVVIPFKYRNAHNFTNSVTCVDIRCKNIIGEDDIMCGLIDKLGNEIVAVGTYNYIDDFIGDYANFKRFVKDGKDYYEYLGLMNEKGEEVLVYAKNRVKIDDYRLRSTDDIVHWKLTGNLISGNNRKTNKWGLSDINGEIVVPYDIYNTMTTFDNGLAIARTDSKMYIIKINGDIPLNING